MSELDITRNAPTIAPATVKGLVRDGLAQTDPEQNRVVITEAGRQWWLELVAVPPERELRPDRDWSPEKDMAPEVSTLAATARALPPLPPATGHSLAHDLALLARLKDTLRLVDLDTLASVPQAAPLVPVLQLLERAG